MRASLSELFKKLKNGIGILVGQAIFKLWIKTANVWINMINNSETAWPT